jgi:hypothetical protein
MRRLTTHTKSKSASIAQMSNGHLAGAANAMLKVVVPPPPPLIVEILKMRRLVNNNVTTIINDSTDS